MEEVSRRSFFKQAGAAAAVAAVATVAPVGLANAVAGAETKVPELTSHEDLTTGENLVAHIKDAQTGEISLFIGQKEVTIHDRQIATRLIRATR
jgi:hypothetical protein